MRILIRLQIVILPPPVITYYTARKQWSLYYATQVCRADGDKHKSKQEGCCRVTRLTIDTSRYHHRETKQKKEKIIQQSGANGNTKTSRETWDITIPCSSAFRVRKNCRSCFSDERHPPSVVKVVLLAYSMPGSAVIDNNRPDVSRQPQDFELYLSRKVSSVFSRSKKKSHHWIVFWHTGSTW